MANIGYIQVNRHCNNKCHFCSNPDNGQNITYNRGIELIDDFIEKKYNGIIFTGGEPTLSPDLVKWIEYSNSKNLDCRIISNGFMCSDFEYIKKLKEAGLSLIHFSLYSHIPKVHDFLTTNIGSYKKVIQAIQNTLKLGINVQINTVMNRYNEDHLDKIVIFLNKQFPNISHFVWNNLDPQMMRKTDIALSTLPHFDIASISLIKAMQFLEDIGKTFRVERLPLCFMRGFEYASTETRKIVKNEERIVHFLDFRESFKEQDWQHEKLEECNSCDLNSICAGIYEFTNFYNYIEVIPQKLVDKEKEIILNKILIKK